MGGFSKEFLLGASTAAHQVEGNNIHSDYWAQEQMGHSSFAEPSLDAIDHYNRYEEDIRLMAERYLQQMQKQMAAKQNSSSGKGTEQDDFFGLQNYTRTLMGAEGSLPAPEGAELTQMNYEFYPEALEYVIRKVAEEFRGDIIVTENGIATADDARRVEFIRRALQGINACLEDGIPVKGYLHWSLLDNFEWQKGFSMTFGLIAVDRKTQTRYPKTSLKYLGSWQQERADDR